MSTHEAECANINEMSASQQACSISIRCHASRVCGWMNRTMQASDKCTYHTGRDRESIESHLPCIMTRTEIQRTRSTPSNNKSTTAFQSMGWQHVPVPDNIHINDVIIHCTTTITRARTFCSVACVSRARGTHDNAVQKIWLHPFLWHYEQQFETAFSRARARVCNCRVITCSHHNR